MKKLLATGTNGFIGKRIKRLIQEKFSDEYELFAIETKNKKYNLLPCLSCPRPYSDQFRNPYALLHLGAFTPKSPEEVNLIHESNSNIYNTQYLLDRLPSKPQKIIFTSTLDVYKHTNEVINEKTPTLPSSMYGRSKLYCEKMLESWSKKNGVILQVLRIGHVYGQGDQSYKKIIPETIRMLKENKSPRITGGGRSVRSLMHVDDVCNLIVNSLRLDEYEGPINVCSSESATIKEITETIIDIYNKDIDIEYIDPDQESTASVFDTSKMKKHLGEDIIRIEDGLKLYES